MEYLAEFGLFVAKIFTGVIAILFVVAGIINIITKSKARDKLTITKLNDFYLKLKHQMQRHLLSKKRWKSLTKKDKAKGKQRDEKQPSKNIFVIDFYGDIKASRVKALRQEISAIITVAKPEDEVLVRLESMGGMVHTYGLAASQLRRLRDHGIPVTVAIDKVAASGGYMMACVSEHIIAAPFAIVGSVGVLAQLPNFHRWLKKNNIDFEQITAGEYKRTLTVFGENTDKGRKKFREEIEQTHQLFKQFIHDNRPQVDIDKIATGEHWHAQDAKALKLVDEIITSDDYLLGQTESANIYHVAYTLPRSKWEKLMEPVQQLSDRLQGWLK